MIFQSKRRKERESLENKKQDPTIQYFTSIETILGYLNIAENDYEKIMLLDYYIRVIKKDMEADNLSFMIYPESNKSGQKNNIPKPPLFSHYYNSEKDKIIRMNESEIIEFDDVSTNGVKWVHRFFDEHEICYDFRMSLIYTLAKLKYYYENHNNRLFYDKYIMIESDDSLKIH